MDYARKLLFLTRIPIDYQLLRLSLTNIFKFVDPGAFLNEKSINFCCLQEV